MASTATIVPIRRVAFASLPRRKKGRRTRNRYGQLNSEHQRNRGGSEFGHGPEFVLTQGDQPDPPE